MADEIKEAEMDEEGIIELLDDDDNVVKFKLVDVTEYKGEKYAFLLPAEPNELVAEDEVAVFLFKEAEQILAPIEDEELMQEVFEFWQNEDDGEGD
ncbi:MAG: DUF1292 domain-containing protein [Candidatus Coproplasma sp.]